LQLLLQLTLLALLRSKPLVILAEQCLPACLPATMRRYLFMHVGPCVSWVRL
jgi:hypothetical protein